VDEQHEAQGKAATRQQHDHNSGMFTMVKALCQATHGCGLWRWHDGERHDAGRGCRFANIQPDFVITRLKAGILPKKEITLSVTFETP